MKIENGPGKTEKWASKRFQNTAGNEVKDNNVTLTREHVILF